MPKRDQPEPTIDTLHAAVDRNIPVEIHARDDSGALALYHSRFVRMEGGDVFIEVPLAARGEDRLHKKQRVECYFSFRGELFRFDSRVVHVGKSVRLNAGRRVTAMQLAGPKEIATGQRRDCVRTSLAGAGVRIEALLVRRDPAQPDVCPVEGPMWRGELVDASAKGFGVMIPGVDCESFRVGDDVFVHFHVPGSDARVTVAGGIRQSRSVLEGTAARLGLEAKSKDSDYLEKQMAPLEEHLVALRFRHRRAS